MRCARCQNENPAGARFCSACGEALARACPACGSPSAAGARFCNRCGSPLEESSEDPAGGPADPERRQLTVMFCDLVGSTQLSAGMDPEELRELLAQIQQSAASVIARFEGHVAQYLGDGMLVYFGYPLAHEDDGPRAVRAALEVQEELGRLNVGLPRPVAMRIGIHTGEVVVGDVGAGGRRERLAMGDTPNIAARVQAQAGEGEVWITEATHHLVEGLFECEDRGARALSGLPSERSLYRVAGESGARSRFEVALRAGLTPLVGRTKEADLLFGLWERAAAGEGQVAFIDGEGGIGKSRLINEVRARVKSDGAPWIEMRCSPYHQNSALHPEIEHLQRFLRFEGGDSPDAKLEKLGSALTRYEFPESDIFPLLAALLSLPQPGAHPPLALSPQRQRQRTLEAYIHWLLADARSGPVCCIWEDLHWADPSTLELIDLFLDQVPANRVLVLLSARPRFRPSWGARPYLSRITLDRLKRREVQAMIGGVARGKWLPAEVVREVVRKTDGVPLFVEELTKMVMESDLLTEGESGWELSGSLPALDIPHTLKDSLMARLDRLAGLRELAQLGAALGREFSYELIQAVSGSDEESLQQKLGLLVKTELVRQKGVPPQSRYRFKHALLQDAAYQSLSRRKRREIHEGVAHALEDRFPETARTQPELLAHHYTEAGHVERALPHWELAGRRAVERSANLEATHHLSRAIELIAQLPEGPKRAQRELVLQTTLGPALMAARGYAAPGVERAFARARELSQQLGETPEVYNVLRGLWGYYIVRADLRTAYELGQQCLALAQTSRGPAEVLWSHYMLGMSLFHLGRHDAALRECEQAYALYDVDKRPVQRALQDPGVASLCYSAESLWFLGHPDRSREKCDEALALAEKIAHPFSLAYAYSIVGAVLLFLRDVGGVEQMAARSIAVAEEQGIPFWLSWGWILDGWVKRERGGGDAAIARLHEGLAHYRDTGGELARPFHMAVLSEAYGKERRADEGLPVVEEALDLVEKTGDRFFEPELLRVKGELLLQVGGPEARPEAEASFDRAIELAREQGAKALELRATTSLARLLQGLARTAEARERLAKIHGTFSEGSDTVDLREAKALLDELSD